MKRTASSSIKFIHYLKKKKTEMSQKTKNEGKKY